MLDVLYSHGLVCRGTPTGPVLFKGTRGEINKGPRLPTLCLLFIAIALLHLPSNFQVTKYGGTVYPDSLFLCWFLIFGMPKGGDGEVARIGVGLIGLWDTQFSISRENCGTWLIWGGLAERGALSLFFQDFLRRFQNAPLSVALQWSAKEMPMPQWRQWHCSSDNKDQRRGYLMRTKTQVVLFIKAENTGYMILPGHSAFHVKWN